MSLTDFVKLHAVAILFPYARELLSHVTARGFYGPMLLPALNIMQLMGSRDATQTTGARQLAGGYRTVYVVRAVSEPAPDQPVREESDAPRTAPAGKRRARHASPPDET